MTKKSFRGGRNIAMKVPAHQYDATVRFYRDVLGLKPLTQQAPQVGFEFGSCQLWIDRVPALSQAEVWLEVVTEDADAAARLFEEEGVMRCDEIERLPEGFRGFWIASPASIVHLVAEPGY